MSVLSRQDLPVRLLRGAFLLCAVLAWTMVMLAGAEWLARLAQSMAADEGAGWVEEQTALLKQADDLEYEKALSGPVQPEPGICRDDPAREAYETLDAAGRKDLVEKRGELVVETDRVGVADSVVAPVTPDEVRAMGEGIKPGDSVLQWMEDAERADLARRLQDPDGPSGRFQEYYVHLPDGRRVCMETTLFILGGGRNRLFFRLSRYQERFTAYRPLVCRQNWYGEDFSRSLFWTNSRGHRDREIVMPKPEGTRRVVCIGGSTTVEGPHNALTYPKFLENRLRGRFGGQRVEVLNCGVDGIGVEATVRRTPQWLSLQPDLIIHYNYINDLGLALKLATDRTFPPDSAYGKTMRFLARSKALQWVRPGLFLPADRDIEAEFRSLLLEPLAKMTRDARGVGAQVALCSFAHPDTARLGRSQRAYFDGEFSLSALEKIDAVQYGRITDLFNRCLAGLCRESGALYVPVAEQLTGGLELFSDICHLRLPGIQRKADIVYDAVADRLAEMDSP